MDELAVDVAVEPNAEEEAAAAEPGCAEPVNRTDEAEPIRPDELPAPGSRDEVHAATTIADTATIRTHPNPPCEFEKTA